MMQKLREIVSVVAITELIAYIYLEQTLLVYFPVQLVINQHFNYIL